MNEQLSRKSKIAIFVACMLIVGGAFTFAVLNWAGVLPIQPAQANSLQTPRAPSPGPAGAKGEKTVRKFF